MRSPEKKAGQRQSGIPAGEENQREFEKLVQRFREADDPDEAMRLGEQVGRMVFGGPADPG